MFLGQTVYPREWRDVSQRTQNDFSKYSFNKKTTSTLSQQSQQYLTFSKNGSSTKKIPKTTWTKGTQVPSRAQEANHALLPIYVPSLLTPLYLWGSSLQYTILLTRRLAVFLPQSWSQGN
jgi:hypothetical protein